MYSNGMKCFEVTKCTKEDQEKCFVFSSYPNKDELENVKCWVLNGAYQKDNDAQLKKCKGCTYYKRLNSEQSISQKASTKATTIKITGTINADRAEMLENVLEELLKKHQYYVVLNLENVTNIYSSGLGAIIKIHKELSNKGGALFISDLQEYVYEILESTSLTRFLKVVDSQAIAEKEIEKLKEQKKAKEKQKQKEVSAKVENDAVDAVSEKSIQDKKELKCWEYWKNNNPMNASSCDECFRKQANSNQACWLVQGSVEDVSFEYVNEDCEDCEYYLLHNN